MNPEFVTKILKISNWMFLQSVRESLYALPWFRNFKERDNLKNTSVNGRVILNGSESNTKGKL